MAHNHRSLSIATMPTILAFLHNSHPAVRFNQLVGDHTDGRTDGGKCYTDNQHSFSPIFHSGSITQTCNWAGGVQSLYCPGLKNSAIPSGTHTITYSAPAGHTPFLVTSFVVDQSQAINTITITNHYTKTAPTITAKSTSTVMAGLMSHWKRAYC